MRLWVVKWYLRRTLSDCLEKVPFLYLLAQRFRYRNKSARKRIIARDTEILIEGFPRSSNSFSVKAFNFDKATVKKKKTATHFHTAVQVVFAKKWRVPSLILVRYPDDAIISTLAKNIQVGLVPSDISRNLRLLYLKYQAKRYARFYRSVISCSDWAVAAHFEETTVDFSKVVQKVNRRFKTDFKIFHHTEEDVEKIFNEGGVHLSPSPDREDLKALLKQDYFSEKMKRHREQARQAYQCFCREYGIVLNNDGTLAERE